MFVFDEVEQVVEYPATFQPRIFNGVSVSIGGIHANSKYIRKQSVNIKNVCHRFSLFNPLKYTMVTTAQS